MIIIVRKAVGNARDKCLPHCDKENKVQQGRFVLRCKQTQESDARTQTTLGTSYPSLFGHIEHSNERASYEERTDDHNKAIPPERGGVRNRPLRVLIVEPVASARCPASERASARSQGLCAIGG